MLPPDAHPPINLHENPSSIYNTWLNNLPQHVKDMVLRKVPECTIQSQFLKIKEGTHFVVPTFLEVTSVLPGSAFWSIFFFLMLLTLGLSTSVGLIHSIITSLQDTFSSLRKQPKLLTVGISLLMFLCGLFFTRPSGTYFIRLLSEYCIILPIIFILICENIAVAWAYGAKRFLEDLTDLLGRPISPIYGWLWCFVSPLVLLVLFAAIVFQLCMKPLVYTAWDSSSVRLLFQAQGPPGSGARPFNPLTY
ncbi:orphan sodium- and chloride-dependent neurotransmitter transporter NTT5-like [Castor canadensis]|uniref:Orphan sodium- and chloride-dependent neurotransmitter transporter NTT5-like n=1 Tax=Castor canadensis TaxID=51338 RepID=A0AC58LA55_CASCN